jgi:hypothetical protein
MKCVTEEREGAIYHSLTVNAIPDVHREEKNVFILRCVSQNEKNKQIEIKGRVIEFLNFNEKLG